MDKPGKYRAAVIGGGMIGAKMKSPDKAWPVTHAAGYSAHEGFELRGICDPILTIGKQDQPCPIYADMDEMMQTEMLDIVSVAVPKEQQYDILKSLLDSSVKAVIAEKPLAEDLKKAEKIVQLYAEKNIPLLVNYSRRYSKTYAELAKVFQNGQEEVLGATISYAKGLLHNGSHAIDLALLLFGKYLSGQSLMQRIDFFEDDPSVSAFMVFEYCPQVYLQALDEKSFTLFMVDIVTKTGRYVIENDHRDMHIWRMEDDVGFPPGKRLVYQEVRKTDYDGVMLALMDNAFGVLEGTQKPYCSGVDALQSMRIIEDLKKEMRRV